MLHVSNGHLNLFLHKIITMRYHYLLSNYLIYDPSFRRLFWKKKVPVKKVSVTLLNLYTRS